jgi:hypothetical protein
VGAPEIRRPLAVLDTLAAAFERIDQ